MNDHLYTAAIGIIAVLIALTAFISDFSTPIKILIVMIGVIIFADSVRKLIKSIKDQPIIKIDKNIPQRITKIDLLGENSNVIVSWELFNKTSAVIGKDIGENSVDIDLSQSPYASMVDVEHAVLNYADGCWYVEDLGSQNGISIKKSGDEKKYKLSSAQPCKLDFGDIIFVGLCQLKLN